MMTPRPISENIFVHGCNKGEFLNGYFREKFIKIQEYTLVFIFNDNLDSKIKIFKFLGIQPNHELTDIFIRKEFDFSNRSKNSEFQFNKFFRSTFNDTAHMKTCFIRDQRTVRRPGRQATTLSPCYVQWSRPLGAFLSYLGFGPIWPYPIFICPPLKGVPSIFSITCSQVFSSMWTKPTSCWV